MCMYCIIATVINIINNNPDTADLVLIVGSKYKYDAILYYIQINYIKRIAFNYEYE